MELHLLIVMQCLIQAWYLSADFQLYVLSYAFLWTLYKWPRAGVAATLSAIVVAVIVQGEQLTDA